MSIVAGYRYVKQKLEKICNSIMFHCRHGRINININTRIALSFHRAFCSLSKTPTNAHTYIYIYFFFFVALRPNAGHGLLILEVSWSHTTTYHSRYDSSGRVISSSQRPLPDNTQHSQQTNINAPGGIRTNDRRRRAAADLRLRPRCHWDRQMHIHSL